MDYIPLPLISPQKASCGFLTVPRPPRQQKAPAVYDRGIFSSLNAKEQPNQTYDTYYNVNHASTTFSALYFRIARVKVDLLSPVIADTFV